MSKGPYSLQFLGERDGNGRGRYEITAVIDGVKYSNKLWIASAYVEQMLIMAEEMNTVYQVAFEYGKRVGKLEAQKEYRKNLEQTNEKLREMLHPKNYVTGNVDISGTSGKGYLHASYADLVNRFGTPGEGDGGYKTRAEWNIRFNDGTVVAIYDWKCGDVKLEDVKEWNVGGRGVACLERLGELFGPEKVIMR